jgi:aminopeptidase N
MVYLKRLVFYQVPLAITLVLTCFTPAGAQRREHAVNQWRPTHYDVNLAFDDQLSQITSARTEINIEVLANKVTNIDLDFGDLPIDLVTVAGAPARFERPPDRLNVALLRPANRGDKVDIVITYHGRPKDGLVFANDRDGSPSATGDNWPNRVHQWIPSLDHPSAKATVSFTVSAPQRYEVIANGKFITVTGNAATSNWKYEEAKPIPPYCMVIVVNQGAVINAPDKTVTNLLYNVPKRDREYAPKGFAPAAPALAFFSQTIAPYPYEKLALIVGATRFGGMENSSAIVFTSTLFDLRPNEKMSTRFGIPTRIEDVVSHEIAHQWFGDSVTESTWADLWLSEGFATYFAGLFTEKYDGEDAFREYMQRAAERYLAYEKQRTASIHDAETEDLMNLLNPNNYEKGAWVLHMLRKRLGDDAFFRGLRLYYEAHKEANATTDDLRAALEKASNQNLQDFFNRWVFGTGHPIYELTWQLDTNTTSVTVTVNQLQKGEAFLDPIPVELTANGEKVRRIIYPKSKLATLTIPLRGKLTAVVLDREQTLLKEVGNR